jgi:hypothetical protein
VAEFSPAGRDESGEGAAPLYFCLLEEVFFEIKKYLKKIFSSRNLNELLLFFPSPPP